MMHASKMKNTKCSQTLSIFHCILFYLYESVFFLCLYFSSCSLHSSLSHSLYFSIFMNQFSFFLRIVLSLSTHFSFFLSFLFPIFINHFLYLFVLFFPCLGTSLFLSFLFYIPSTDHMSKILISWSMLSFYVCYLSPSSSSTICLSFWPIFASLSFNLN